jgi:hypothetical protein
MNGSNSADISHETVRRSVLPPSKFSKMSWPRNLNNKLPRRAGCVECHTVSPAATDRFIRVPRAR